MSFGEMLLETLTNKPVHLREPVFYKAKTDAKRQLDNLNDLLRTCPASFKESIEQDIRSLSYGLAGEDQIEFELKNSHQPMIVLRDLRLEHEDLTAQIDFMVITPKITYILECKYLYGNIEVTQTGDFIRTSEYKGKKFREGIYNPITQNQRHLDLIKKILLDRASNSLKRTILNAKFGDWYQSLVVLANPKTILDIKKAPKNFQSQIIRADQLIQTIGHLNDKSKEINSFEAGMFDSAETFLSLHVPNPIDYSAKYQQPVVAPQISEKQIDLLALEQTPLYQQLKKFRTEISQTEGVKPYVVFTNAELADLIAVNPRSLDELKKVKGFGEFKCQKYGPAIIEILVESTNGAGE
jgi:hypothetical protein